MHSPHSIVGRRRPQCCDLSLCPRMTRPRLQKTHLTQLGQTHKRRGQMANKKGQRPEPPRSRPPIRHTHVVALPPARSIKHPSPGLLLPSLIRPAFPSSLQKTHRSSAADVLVPPDNAATDSCWWRSVPVADHQRALRVILPRRLGLQSWLALASPPREKL